MTNLSVRVAKLLPLDRRAPFQSTRSCKICGGRAIYFDQVDFNKYCDTENYFEFGISGIQIEYFRCLFCGFIFTEDFDDWSRSAFAELIYNDDYVKVDGEYVNDRPAFVAQNFASRLHGCEGARILDFGSGAGVFVERMHDFGFRNVEAYDPFSSPRRPSGAFDIVTCFEVIEHSPDPVGTVGAMREHLRDDGCIIFSQTVHPPDILAVRGSWWYLAPRNGHVSTFSEEALVELGRRHGLALHRDSNVYAFAPPAPSSFACHALNSVGPSFNTLRLLAPRALANTVIAFPSRSDVCWHPTTADGIWRWRWTGVDSLSWRGSWGRVSTIQVRIPFVREAEPGFAARCEIAVLGERKPVRIDRGELIADFDVRGSLDGTVTLHTPAPVVAGHGRPFHPPGAHGLAILLSQEPCWPGRDFGVAVAS